MLLRQHGLKHVARDDSRIKQWTTTESCDRWSPKRDHRKRQTTQSFHGNHLQTITFGRYSRTVIHPCTLHHISLEVISSHWVGTRTIDLLVPPGLLAQTDRVLNMYTSSRVESQPASVVCQAASCRFLLTIVSGRTSSLPHLRTRCLPRYLLVSLNKSLRQRLARSLLADTPCRTRLPSLHWRD